MAKKKKDPTAESAGAGADAATESKTARKANYNYTLGKELGEGDKAPTQMRQILTIVKDAGGTISRADLLEKMKGVVQTRQPIERILGFYQSRMIRDGLLTVSSPAEEKQEAAA